MREPRERQRHEDKDQIKFLLDIIGPQRFFSALCVVLKDAEIIAWTNAGEDFSDDAYIEYVCASRCAMALAVFIESAEEIRKEREEGK
jgi:hypothetical protein